MDKEWKNIIFYVSKCNILQDFTHPEGLKQCEMRKFYCRIEKTESESFMCVVVYLYK